VDARECLNYGIAEIFSRCLDFHCPCTSEDARIQDIWEKSVGDPADHPLFVLVTAVYFSVDVPVVPSDTRLKMFPYAV